MKLVTVNLNFNKLTKLNIISFVTKFILFLILFNLQIGCNFKVHLNNKKPGSGVIAKLPWKYPNQSEYSIQDVPFYTLNNISPLRGQAARIIIHPEILSDRIAGPDFSLKYTLDNENKILPLNRLSAQALVVYAHMENFYFWDRALELPSSLREQSVVGLDARIIDSGDVHGSGSYSVNNAQHNGLLRAILIDPYQETGVPLSINGGVLAHEHFHALFFDLSFGSILEEFQKQLVEIEKENAKKQTTNLMSHIIEFDNELKINAVDPHRRKSVRTNLKIGKEEFTETELDFFYNLILLKAFNEGLADVWGWLYTGDADFISHSLQVVKLKLDGNSRELKLKSLDYPLKSSLEIRSEIENHKYGVYGAVNEMQYQLGTQLASTVFKRIVDSEKSLLLNEQQRNKWSQKIINVVASLKGQFHLLGTNDINFTQFLKKLIFDDTEVKTLSQEECDSWSEFFKSDEKEQILKHLCPAT